MVARSPTIRHLHQGVVYRLFFRENLFDSRRAASQLRSAGHFFPTPPPPVWCGVVRTSLQMNFGHGQGGSGAFTHRSLFPARTASPDPGASRPTAGLHSTQLKTSEYKISWVIMFRTSSKNDNWRCKLQPEASAGKHQSVRTTERAMSLHGRLS
jgi:hypothetical protein